MTQRTNRFLRPRATAAAQRAAAAKARATPTATGDTATAPRPAASGPRRSPPASPARATQGSDGAQPPPVPGRKRSGKARNRPRRVAPDQSSLRRAQSASPRQQHVASNTTPAPAPARASTPGAGELRPTPRAAAAPSPSPAASGSSTPVTAQPAVASAPAPDAPPPAGVPVPEHVVESGPVVMPDHIDEDLRNSGKSDFVIAGIQRRRDAAAASHAVRAGGGSLCVVGAVGVSAPLHLLCVRCVVVGRERRVSCNASCATNHVLTCRRHCHACRALVWCCVARTRLD